MRSNKYDLITLGEAIHEYRNVTVNDDEITNEHLGIVMSDEIGYIFCPIRHLGELMK